MIVHCGYNLLSVAFHSYTHVLDKLPFIITKVHWGMCINFLRFTIFRPARTGMCLFSCLACKMLTILLHSIDSRYQWMRRLHTLTYSLIETLNREKMESNFVSTEHRERLEEIYCALISPLPACSKVCIQFSLLFIADKTNSTYVQLNVYIDAQTVFCALLYLIRFIAIIN